MNETQHEILLFYKYVKIADPVELVVSQKELCEGLGLTGRVLIAHEGINATLEGTKENIGKYVDHLTQDPRFEGVHLKRSAGDGQSFPRLVVKARQEIVSGHLGDMDVDPNEITGKHITAQELHELIHSGEEFYIIDMRNDYEHKVGYFKDSILPNLRNFRDLPAILPDIAHLKDKKVVTVCTGGVRCEKASGFLVKNGFSDVSQLYGGIVTYMETYPNEDFLGKLYVFDGRLMMGFNTDSDEHQVVGRCEICDAVCEEYTNCENDTCHKHFICCPNCKEKYQGTCSQKCLDEKNAKQDPVLDQIADLRNEILILSELNALAEWDQEVMMPLAAADGRAMQLQYLSTKIHSLITDPKLKELADHAEPEIAKVKSPSEQKVWRAEIRNINRMVDKATKLPEEFVARKSQLVSKATSVYASAKPKNDWESFQPYLKQLIELSREEGRLLGDGDPYENLIDNFDEGLKISTLDRIFAQLEAELPKIIAANKIKQVNPVLNSINFVTEKQNQVNQLIINKIGLTAGNIRLDTSVHPFSLSVGYDDGRITTRIKETDIRESLFAVLHESGHAYYELGVNQELHKFFVGRPDSLTIHESQSRFWENMLGRSMNFWDKLYKEVIQEVFKSEFKDVSQTEWYNYINEVKPDLIRTSADELTYSMHIVIRYKLEKALIDGSLDVQDLPNEWNKLYKQYLNVEPSQYNEGVMQDIHWAHGTFGYFPTYTTGTILSAMLMKRYLEIHPEGAELIAQNKLKSVRSFLQKTIWSRASTVTAAELVQEVFGEELNVEAYLAYLRQKYN